MAKAPVKKKKSRSIPAAIYTLGDNSHKNNSINALIYGVNGVGKTPFWGSGDRVLIGNSDEGLESARANKSKADAWDVRDFDAIEQVYQFLANEKHDYNWFVWDSLTQFQDRTLIDDILQDAVLVNPKQDPDVASPREYLQSQNRIMRYVRQFAALPINFGISCHVSIAESKDEANEGEMMYVPAISGGGNTPGSTPLYSKVCGYMDVIGYMHEAKLKGEKKTITRIMFKGDATHIARDRTRSLGRQLSNPTLPQMETLIAATKTKKKKTSTTTKKVKKQNG